MKLFHGRSLSFLSAVLCAIAFAGCNQDILNDHGRRSLDGAGQTGSSNKGVAPVDFQQVNKIVLAPNCVKCHGSDSGREDLSTYASVKQTVVPGNADQSPLFQSLQGAGFGGTMPRRASPLAAEQLTLIRDWINGGAIERAEAAPPTAPSPEPSSTPLPPAPSPTPIGSPVASPSPSPQPEAMKYDELNNLVLGPKCARCHASGDASGGVKFDSYHDVFAVKGLVIPGDPNKSLLYQVVRDNEMPPSRRSQLPDSDKELIRKWIADGAQN